jgi:hypothetical protein
MALPTHSGPRPLIQFRNHFSQTVGLLGRVISLSQGRYLHTEQHKYRINAYRHQTSMPWVGFDPTIPGTLRVCRQVTTSIRELCGLSFGQRSVFRRLLWYSSDARERWKEVPLNRAWLLPTFVPIHYHSLISFDVELPFAVYTEVLSILRSNWQAIKTPLIISKTEEISWHLLSNEKMLNLCV